MLTKNYSDIKDDDCIFYKGKTLKHFYSSCRHLEFEVIKDNKRYKTIYNPYAEFEDDKQYKCFEYSRISGAGIEYNKIAIIE